MNSDYIRRDTAFKTMRTEMSETLKDVDPAGPGGIVACLAIASAVQALSDTPAETVRPVITCGECIHSEPTGVEYICKKHSGHREIMGEQVQYTEYHGADWFCADANSFGEALNK